MKNAPFFLRFARIFAGVLFCAAVFGCSFVFPSEDPDRWKYVSVSGIPVTLQCGEETAVWQLFPEAGRDAVRRLSADVALPMIAYEQGFGAQKALEIYYPDTIAAIGEWIGRFEQNPTDAQLEVGTDTAFRFIAGNNGVSVNRDALYKDLIQTVLAGGGTVKVDLSPVSPTVTRADLYSETRYRGGFETNISASSDARKHNVRLALSKFDGLSVPAGAQVSFNQTVGARTTEAGYKTAKIIYLGEYADGVGGGVCQASTTLYNAVIAAGLESEKVFRHSLAPSYVAPGRDAMVNSTGADFVFKNPTARNVHFRVYGDDTRVRVEVFGEQKTGKTYLESRVTGRIPARWVEKEDDGTYAEILKTQKEVVVRKPRDGLTSQTYLHTVDASGAETVRLVRTDTYNAIGGIKVVRPVPTPYRQEERARAAG